MFKQFLLRVGSTTLGVLLACAIFAAVFHMRSEAGPPVATGSGDVNGDGVVNIADAITLLDFLFGAGPAPVACAGPSCPACDLSPAEVDKLSALLPMITIGPGGNLTISSSGLLSIQAATATLSTSGNLNISASATLDLNGSLITLN